MFVVGIKYFKFYPLMCQGIMFIVGSIIYHALLASTIDSMFPKLS